MKTLLHKYIITATLLLLLAACNNKADVNLNNRPTQADTVVLQDVMQRFIDSITALSPTIDTPPPIVATTPKKNIAKTIKPIPKANKSKNLTPEEYSAPPPIDEMPEAPQALPEPSSVPNTKPDTIDDNGRREGLIGVDIPQEMKQGKVSFVKVYLIRSLDTAALTRKLSDNVKKNLIIDQLSLSDVANVTLTDPSGGKNFNITKQGQDNHDQLVEADGRSQWQWGVTPLTAGNNKIVVTVTIKVKYLGTDYYKEIETHNQVININVNYVYSATNFVNEHWEWFAGTIFLPIIAFFRKKLKAMWLNFIAKFKKKEKE